MSEEDFNMCNNHLRRVKKSIHGQLKPTTTIFKKYSLQKNVISLQIHLHRTIKNGALFVFTFSFLKHGSTMNCVSSRERRFLLKEGRFSPMKEDSLKELWY